MLTKVKSGLSRILGEKILIMINHEGCHKVGRLDVSKKEGLIEVKSSSEQQDLFIKNILGVY